MIGRKPFSKRHPYTRAHMNDNEPDLEPDNDYPSEDELQEIIDWPATPFPPRYLDLMGKVHRLWMWQDRFCAGHDQLRKVYVYELSTGGWSGNEELIEALRKNRMFWISCWVQSRRGGHYIFEIRAELA